MMISNNPVGNLGKLPANDVTVKSTDSIAVPKSLSHDVSKLLKTNSLLDRSSAIRPPAPVENAPSEASNFTSGGNTPVSRLDERSIKTT